MFHLPKLTEKLGAVASPWLEKALEKSEVYWGKVKCSLGYSQALPQRVKDLNCCLTQQFCPQAHTQENR